MDKRIEERRGKADYDRRLEAMHAAWREWRNDVVKAMAERVRVAGDAEEDDELGLLSMEFDHMMNVRRELANELGIDAADVPDEGEV